MRISSVNGMNISKMTLGTVQLGMDYGIANKSGKPDMESSMRMLRKALSLGVTCLDTARGYGQSEEVLGQYLQNIDEGQKPTIVTKIIVQSDETHTAVEVEEEIRRLVKQSLESLRLEKIDVMLIHHAEALKRQHTAISKTFAKLIEEGVLGKVGVSFGANIKDQFPVIWPIVEDELFEVIQIPMNILDHRLIHNGGLTLFQQHQKIVFARSVFLQGLLFLEESQLPENLKVAVPFLDELRKIAHSEQMSVAQLAVCFARDLDGIHSLVVGADTEEQIVTNVNWVNDGKISELGMKWIFDAFAEIPEQVINTALW